MRIVMTAGGPGLIAAGVLSLVFRLERILRGVNLTRATRNGCGGHRAIRPQYEIKNGQMAAAAHHLTIRACLLMCSGQIRG